MDFLLKEYLQIKGLSQTKLAEQLGVAKNSVNQWASGKRLPPFEMAAHIADTLGVSLDELTGRVRTPHAGALISKAKLAELDGMPVFLSDDVKLCAWALWNSLNRTFTFSDGTTLSLDRFDGQVYAYPPTYLVGLIGAGEPLPPETIGERTRVWVEPISPDAELRNELRGWYDVKERYVENEFQIRMYYCRYGVKWLAFADSMLR